LKFQLYQWGDFMSKLKNEILRDVGMLARCVQTMSDIKYRKLKLQKGQFTFLTRICEHPGINLICLSNILKVDKTTTTKAVQKLIKDEYVRREQAPDDKRSWKIFPANKALAIYPCIIHEENSYIETCLNGFNQEEKEMACFLFRKMRENIEREWKHLRS